MKKISQEKLLLEFFINNPSREIKHPEIVDWAVKEYKKEREKFSEIQIEVLGNFFKKVF